MFEYLSAYKAGLVIFAVIGGILNAAGKWQGFLFWLVTNGYWCWYNFWAGEYEQAIIFLVFELLCVFGIWKWRAPHRGGDIKEKKEGGKWVVK